MVLCRSRVGSISPSNVLKNQGNPSNRSQSVVLAGACGVSGFLAWSCWGWILVLRWVGERGIVGGMKSAEEWLYSEETGREFSHCVRCRMPLLETDGPWLVNKDYFRGECVREYAICRVCRDAVTEGFSDESKESVRSFLETAIDWEGWLARAMMMPDATGRFAGCVSCGAKREQVDGFGVSAYFDPGGSLVAGPLPLLICGGCVGRMTAGLSEESRGVWKDFQERYLTGFPGDSDYPGMF